MTSSSDNTINVSLARRLVLEEQARIESSLAYLDWSKRGPGMRRADGASGRSVDLSAAMTPGRLLTSDHRG